MSDVKRERFGVLVERDDAERLSADDQATQREAEFLADALLVQKLHTVRRPPAPRGVCCNCEAVCLPMAVYCDEDCKADHEARERASARQRRCVG